MTESVLSTHWYRIANLKPSLRDATTVNRHVYRGQPWYVLRNRLNGRSHRFNAAAYALIGLMDGQNTVQQIWEHTQRRPVAVLPAQDEVIRLLCLLHDADLIQSDILPSTVELVHQFQQMPGHGWKQRAANPFSMKFPLWDPERFLTKWTFFARRLFTVSALVIWLLIVLSAIALAVLNWPELTNNLSDRILSPGNLLLMWLVYPLVKIFHEFGHAFAVKKWGGEVHEMGIILLAMTPVPYVDASASSCFPEKHQRVAVAGMGMAVELLLAALALFVWLNVQPGVIKAIAYNVMLIGGVSTLLFNGNPLLRYDGYYMLADLAEIPNLAQRATQYISYLLQRYLIRIETAESPITAPGEKTWFLIYGPISYCYRMVVLVGLVWFVSGRFFVFGVLVALWGAFSLLIFPIVRNLMRFLKSPTARAKRTRMVTVVCAAMTSLALLLFVIPFPLWTATQGVVWLPNQSIIRAGADCEILKVLVPAEHVVAKDTPLIQGVDPFLEAQIEIHQAHLDELYANYNALPLHKRVKRKLLLEEIARVKGDFHQTEEKRKKLLVRSATAGKLILTEARNLPGRFIKKGELLGYIFAEHRPTIRAVVKQTDIGLVRERLQGVEVRMADQPAITLQAELLRIIPAADLKLPSAALGTTGGGDIPVDPTDSEGLRAMETVFQLDINLPEGFVHNHIGERAHIRLEHGTMPLAMQCYRRLRQIFLRKFYV